MSTRRLHVKPEDWESHLSFAVAIEMSITFYQKYSQTKWFLNALIERSPWIRLYGNFKKVVQLKINQKSDFKVIQAEVLWKAKCVNKANNNLTICNVKRQVTRFVFGERFPIINKHLIFWRNFSFQDFFTPSFIFTKRHKSFNIY